MPATMMQTHFIKSTEGHGNIFKQVSGYILRTVAQYFYSWIQNTAELFVPANVVAVFKSDCVGTASSMSH